MPLVSPVSQNVELGPTRRIKKNSAVVMAYKQENDWLRPAALEGHRAYRLRRPGGETLDRGAQRYKGRMIRWIQAGIRRRKTATPDPGMILHRHLSPSHTTPFCYGQSHLYQRKFQTRKQQLVQAIRVLIFFGIPPITC